MPPRELPGFYFDVERNRYFPLASRPPPAPSASSSTNLSNARQTSAGQDDDRLTRRRRRVLWSCAADTTTAGRAREARTLLHTRFAATQRACVEQVRWPFRSAGNVCAFRTTPTRQFMGDELGWLYSRARAESSPSHYGDAEDNDLNDGWTEWSPELCLAPQSEISALCTTSTRCVAVCFGPATKICVQETEEPDRTSLLHLAVVHDVRAASLQGRALVLGAARQAVLIPDLDVSSTVRMLPTRTDVFSVAQQENLVYAGTRAGTVLRFDTRTNKSSAQVMFESGGNDNTGPGANTSSSKSQRSSVVFVQPTHQGQALVVGCTDGRLATYDLRFVRPAAAPVVSYAGQPSAVSYSGRLGLALDPEERFLFAAGPDARLRAWALDSGAPLVPPALASSEQPVDLYAHPPSSNAQCNPFATPFVAPLSALQVVDDDRSGAVLWASGGGEVWRWRLGL
ncbi:hypothetical protein B0H19DRAFT_1108914 [Mycena capillaripes]|nr:hypothetical protein B0H19DRAFT_1108914 [Mycena capillaripes]